MKVIGLTGAVAMGKSTTVRMLRYLGYPVFDADAIVAMHYANNVELVYQIECVFPDCLDEKGFLSKSKLAQKVFSDQSAREILESLFHPLVNDAAIRFVEIQRRHRQLLVFWDVPLLFQSELQQYCSEVWVVSCPRLLQRRRALERKNWNSARFEAISALQLPPTVQQRMADRVIFTGLGKAATFRALKRNIAKCLM